VSERTREVDFIAGLVLVIALGLVALWSCLHS